MIKERNTSCGKAINVGMNPVGSKKVHYMAHEKSLKYISELMINSRKCKKDD